MKRRFLVFSSPCNSREALCYAVFFIQLIVINHFLYLLAQLFLAEICMVKEMFLFLEHFIKIPNLGLNLSSWDRTQLYRGAIIGEGYPI